MDNPDATPTVQIDNEQIKVTRWDFPPNGQTGWHRHEMNYLVVPLTTGKLLLETPEGEMTNELIVGVPYYRTSGAEHNVINRNNFEFSFIETEFK